MLKSKADIEVHDGFGDKADDFSKMNTRSGRVVGIEHVIRPKPVSHERVTHGRTVAIIEQQKEVELNLNGNVHKPKPVIDVEQPEQTDYDEQLAGMNKAIKFMQLELKRMQRVKFSMEVIEYMQNELRKMEEEKLNFEKMIFERQKQESEQFVEKINKMRQAESDKLQAKKLKRECERKRKQAEKAAKKLKKKKRRSIQSDT